MSPISGKKTVRRLVLGRETVRALTEARPPRAITMLPQEVTSCGAECGCTGMMQAR